MEAGSPSSDDVTVVETWQCQESSSGEGEEEDASDNGYTLLPCDDGDAPDAGEWGGDDSVVVAAAEELPPLPMSVVMDSYKKFLPKAAQDQDSHHTLAATPAPAPHVSVGDIDVDAIRKIALTIKLKPPSDNNNNNNGS